MEPASAEKLLQAFQILDADGKGTLSKECTCKLMSEEGEPFSQVHKYLVVCISTNMVEIQLFFLT